MPVSSIIKAFCYFLTTYFFKIKFFFIVVSLLILSNLAKLEEFYSNWLYNRPSVLIKSMALENKNISSENNKKKIVYSFQIWLIKYDKTRPK